MTLENIWVDNFEGYNFYNCMVDINNDIFKVKLKEIYESLKQKHIAEGKYTEENIKNNVVYDPSSYLEDFNIFSYPLPELHTLLKNIKKLLLSICEKENIDIDLKQYYIHGWLNYFPVKMHEFRDYEEFYWHDHGTWEDCFHGYYAVNAEPSTTHYRKNNVKLDRENKNGKLILARNGIEHAVGKWNLNEPRITIAYNLNPVSDAQKIHNSHMPNMLMPLI